MLKTRKVLVVDDDAGVRAALGGYLTKAGYAVVSAESGSAGLRLLQKGPLPDLLVLDLMMPQMSGFEMVEQLKLHPVWAVIPVIVLTATPGHTSESLKVDAMLRKPFDLADVQAAIHLALAAKKKRPPTAK